MCRRSDLLSLSVSVSRAPPFSLSPSRSPSFFLLTVSHPPKPLTLFLSLPLSLIPYAAPPPKFFCHSFLCQPPLWSFRPNPRHSSPLLSLATSLRPPQPRPPFTPLTAQRHRQRGANPDHHGHEDAARVDAAGHGGAVLVAEGDALVGANAHDDEERGENERQDQYRPHQPLSRSLCIADCVRYSLHLHEAVAWVDEFDGSEKESNGERAFQEVQAAVLENDTHVWGWG